MVFIINYSETTKTSNSNEEEDDNGEKLMRSLKGGDRKEIVQK